VSACHLRVSRPCLGQYLRVVANSSYRKIKPIMPIHNEMRCKLQRQLAASKYIQALYAGMTILNIDEAVIHFTDHRSRGWMRRGQLNQVTTSVRVRGINVIGALSSSGEFLFTVNCGNTNSNTFGLFIMKLVSHLDHQDAGWRLRTVLMMDNAIFHRAKATLPLYEQLQVPVLFLGPYHFRMAPVEMAFNHIKSHELKTQLRSIYTT
jgi:hypothetical protein